MSFQLKNESDNEELDFTFKGGSNLMIKASDDENSQSGTIQNFDAKSTVSSVPDVFKSYSPEISKKEREPSPEPPSNSIWGFSNLINKDKVREYDEGDNGTVNIDPVEEPKEETRDFFNRNRKQSGYSSSGSMFRNRKASILSRGSRESFPAYKRKSSSPRKHGNVNFRKRELLNELRELVDHGYVAHNNFDMEDSIDEIMTEVKLGQKYFERLSASQIASTFFYKLVFVVEYSTKIYNPLKLNLTGLYEGIMAKKKAIDYEIKLIVRKYITDDSAASSPEFRLLCTLLGTVVITHFNNTVAGAITDKVKQPGGLTELVGAFGPMLSGLQKAAADSMGRSPQQVPQQVPQQEPTPASNPDISSIFSKILTPQTGNMPMPVDTRADEIPKKPASVDSDSVITLEPNMTIKPKKSRKKKQSDRKTYDI